MSYTRVEREITGVIPCVASATEQDQADIKGYLVVAVMRDNTMVIAHNTCCVPCILAKVANYVHRHADLMKPRPEYASRHTS